jgi:excisionase family DNA binding protein
LPLVHPAPTLHNLPQSSLRWHIVEPFLDERQLAKLLNVSPRTLQNKRVTGGGIPFVRIGKAIRYSPEDVAKYLEQHKLTSTSPIKDVDQ